MVESDIVGVFKLRMIVLDDAGARGRRTTASARASRSRSTGTWRSGNFTSSTVSETRDIMK